jgi:DNA-binding NarL/FixJ family response regulator
MDKIKVIIAEDSDFVREGMRIILSVDEDFEVIGCAANGLEAVKIAKEYKADVILMDIQMPEMDGIEATKEIVSQNLGRVLILTTFDDYDLVKKAIHNGAKGYLIKNHKPEQLKQMIKSIHSGASVMDEGLLEKLTSGDSAASEDFLVGNLTLRELDIVKAVAEGLSNKKIAEKLFISEGTVKNYISTILEKENISHRTALAVYYLTGKK